MDPDEIRQLLFDTAKLRMPKREEGQSTRDFLSKLEDYLIQTAVARGELEEARLYMNEALHRLEQEWRDIEGWQSVMGGNTKNATQNDIMEAKRKVKPDLYDGIRDGKFLRERLTEQIKRLGKLGDDEVVSRAYTLMAGS